MNDPALKLTLKLSLVYASQIALFLFLYRSRAVDHAEWIESDLLLFCGPHLFGAVLSTIVIMRSGILNWPALLEVPIFVKAPLTFLFAALLGVVGVSISVGIALNVWGS